MALSTENTADILLVELALASEDHFEPLVAVLLIADFEVVRNVFLEGEV